MTEELQPTELELTEAAIREASDFHEFRHYGTRNGAKYMTSFGIESASAGKRIVTRSRLEAVGDDYACRGFDTTVEDY